MSVLESELVTLHVALVPTAAGKPLTLHAMGGTYALQPHTPATLKEHRSYNRALAAMPASHLVGVTHFASGIQLSRTHMGICYATQPSDDPDNPIGDMVAISVHLPRAARRLAAQRRHREDEPIALPNLLHHMGAGDVLLHASAEDRLQLMLDSAIVLSPFETARSILFQHPEIASANLDIAADMLDGFITEALKKHTELWEYISRHPAGSADSWERTRYAQNEDGTPVRPPDDVVDKDNLPIPWPKGSDGQPVVPQSELSDGVLNAAKSAVDYVLRESKNSKRMMGIVWQPTQGVTAMQSKKGVSVPRTAGLRSTEHSGLQANAAVDPLTGLVAAEVYKWTLANSGSSWGLAINDSVSFDANTQEVTVKIRNKANRAMGAYVQFSDSTGKTLTPIGWVARTKVSRLEPSDTKRYLGFVRPVDCIFGIPANIFGSELSLSFPFIQGATKAKVLLGGLGQGEGDRDVQFLGQIGTGSLCYGVPGFMIALGIGLDSSSWYFSLLTNPVVLEAITSFLFEGGGEWQKTWDIMFFLRKMAGSIPTILFSKGVARWIVKPLYARVAGAQAAQAAPIAGWVIKVMCLTAAGGMIISTTVATSNAPGVYALELSRSIDVAVKVLPDVTKGGDQSVWPLLFHRYEITLQNGSGAVQKPVPGNRVGQNTPIEHTFLNVPAGTGDTIQITANLYSENGWLCGVWVSDWIPAMTTDGTTTLKVTGSIVERLAPLTADTTYSHKKKLAFESGKHVWKETNTPPPDVWLPVRPAGGIDKLINITSNNFAYRVGYTWLAENMNLPLDNASAPTNVKMYAFACVSTLVDPEKGGKQPGRGFSVQPYLAFDQFGPEPLLTLPLSDMANLDSAQPLSAGIVSAFRAAGKTLPASVAKKVVTATAEWQLGEQKSTSPGWLYVVRRQPNAIAVYPVNTPAFSPRNFYLDTRAVSGRQHLRHVDLNDASKEFNYDVGKSWGSFKQTNLDAVVIHPRGYALAASYETNKIEVLELKGVFDDTSAPEAIAMSGAGRMEGLIQGPRAMTVTADGRILVLEQNNKRVQAFDVFTNPVQCFTGPLSFDLAQPFKATLDAETVSPELAAIMQSNVRPNVAPRVRLEEFDSAALDAAEFTPELRSAMTSKGLALDAATKVKVITADNIWLAEDPSSTLNFELRVERGDLTVRNAPRWSVEVQSPGARWLLRDSENAQTFQVSINAAGTALKAQQLIATMALNDQSDTLEYLDLACEPEGFIYVLSYVRPGSRKADYRLDIYSPDGTHLARTPKKDTTDDGVNGAKITVDHWRTLFTLNYERISGPGGRPEPSVSQWSPSAPPKSERERLALNAQAGEGE